MPQPFAFILFVAIPTALTYTIGFLVMDYKSVLAEQHQQNQSPITHNAKGHQSHQVIIYQDSSDGCEGFRYLVFDLSKPAAIISFEDIAGKQSPDTTKDWELAASYMLKIHLKNVTQGSVI